MMLLYRPTLPVYSPKRLTVGDSVAFRCAHRDTTASTLEDIICGNIPTYNPGS